MAKKKVVKKPAKKPVKKKAGRKTEYKARYATIAFEFCKDGHFSARALAKKFKVSPSTIASWKEKHTDFADAIKMGIDVAVDDVQETYFKLAKGGLKTKKTKYESEDGDDEDAEMVLTEKTITTLAPNAQVCNRILAAHRSETYGDNVELKHGVTEELSKLLDVIDGSSKGKLPDKKEERNAG